MYLVEIITETNVESHGMLRRNIERSTYSMEMKTPNRLELLFQGCQKKGDSYHHFYVCVKDSKTEEELRKYNGKKKENGLRYGLTQCCGWAETGSRLTRDSIGDVFVWGIHLTFPSWSELKGGKRENKTQPLLMGA